MKGQGAQALVPHNTPVSAATRQAPPSDLNVEVDSSGAIRVMPTTNAPAQ